MSRYLVGDLIGQISTYKCVCKCMNEKYLMLKDKSITFDVKCGLVREVFNLKRRHQIDCKM